MRPWLAAEPPLPDELTPGGRDYNQAEVVSETDGDTARLLRRRVVVRSEDRDDLGPAVITDARVRVWEDDAAEFPKGLAGRLVNLDTPEKRSKDPAERARAVRAEADLTRYVDAAGDRLRCITYDTGGGFDRMLVDLYYVDVDGRRVTASECMLVLGWPPYVRGV